MIMLLLHKVAGTIRKESAGGVRGRLITGRFSTGPLLGLASAPTPEFYLDLTANRYVKKMIHDSCKVDLPSNSLHVS